MARDIRITPHLGSTATGEYPEIKFRGISQSFINLKVDDDGSVKYTGTYGTLFNITDNKDGLLHSVNDISGLPILSVYSYDYVQMGKWDKYTLCVNSNKVGIGLTGPSSSLHIYSTQSGAFRLEDGTQVANYVLTSDVNGVGTWQPSTGVGGSGTTNYIPKWLSASSLSSTSSIYDNGLLVGIGTITPTAKLDIQHTAYSTPAFNVYNTSTNTGYGTIGAKITLDAPTAWAPIALSVTNLSSTAYGIGVDIISNINGMFVHVNSTTYSYAASHNFAAGKGIGIQGCNIVSGSEYALTNSYRGILIGMSNNTADISNFADGGSILIRRLRNDTVTSIVSLQNADELGSIIFQGRTNYSYANEISTGSDFTSGAGIKSFINGTPSFGGTTSMPANLIFYTNDGANYATINERMRIEYNGNVGINTPTPSHKLHIYDGSGLGAFRLEDATQAAGYALISDANGVGTWQPSGGLGAMSGTIQLITGQATVYTPFATTASRVLLSYTGNLASGWTFTPPINTIQIFSDNVVDYTSFQIEAWDSMSMNDTTNNNWVHWLIIN